MGTLPFTQSDIQQNFDAQDLARGRAYWRDGAVINLRIENDGRTISAKVRGTKTRPYEVDITVSRPLKSGAGKTVGPFIDSDCTCPVGNACKHGAAACLAALAQVQKHNYNLELEEILAMLPPHLRATFRARHTPETHVDPVQAWLDDLTEATQPAHTPQKKEQVLYLLDAPEDNAYSPRQARLRMVVAKILKDGSYGATRSVAPHQLNYRPAYAAPEDTAIIKLMQAADMHSSDMRSPPIEQDMFDLILQRALATGRCFWQSNFNVPLTLGEQKSAHLGWRIEVDGTQSSAIIVNDGVLPFTILPAARPWYLDAATNTLGPLHLDMPLPIVHKFLSGPKLPPDVVKDIARKMNARALPSGIVPPREITIEHRAAQPPLPRLQLTQAPLSAAFSGNWDQPEPIIQAALLNFNYAGVLAEASQPDSIRRQEDGKLIIQPRDKEFETDFITRLTQNTGLKPAKYASNMPDALAAYDFGDAMDSRARWINFTHREVPALRAEGWQVDVDDDFSGTFNAIKIANDDWEAELRETEPGAWWFSFDLGIIVAGERVALLPLLLNALRQLPEPSTAAIETLSIDGTCYVTMPDGRALALPFDRVRDILTTLVELYDRPINADGSISVSIDLATALSRIDAATQMRWLGGKKLQTLVARLKDFSSIPEIAVPRGLSATLRPYQREGLNWLQFLRDYNLGGILADDMGLGKTVQTLAHILVEKNARRLDRPCLIICPTSLVPNWEDETAKFAPKLKRLSLHGKDRAERVDEIASMDLVITTYPLLPRDREILMQHEWHMIVLDEAQAIKNPQAKITQLACELNARHRLCLTGTPVENHLGEVWSQFAFLMPGMLGTHKEFTKRFRNPIEKSNETARQSVLARRLKPFILRRNKSDVAKELPPKTEIIHAVEFADAQRDLYETLRLTMHEKVRDAVESKGFNRSRIVILDALLKLRQACCDPRLVKLAGAKKAAHSAKLQSLMEMLPELVEEGRRILLFSQFTSMLDLIKPELDKINIPYVEIRGDTTDRKTPVRKFQNGEVPLFLISLKAGGTGLNLTAGDTVIHYDPWWNPAVENQATDRAHRIGQDKPVFVYKFIVRGTVEERILELQDRKRALAEALLQDRPDAAAAFAPGDLDFLFL